jgi:alpha-tubulin suppressor-like RCC1 family protein
LGNGNTTDTPQTTPVPVLAEKGDAHLSGVKSIAAGTGAWEAWEVGAFSLALLEDTTVRAWGLNNHGQLGMADGKKKNQNRPVPVLATTGGEPLGGVTAIAAGGYHALALLEDTTVRAWGYNKYGQLGNGEHGENTAQDAPVPVVATKGSDEPLRGVVAIAAGLYFSMALLDDGTVRAWGDNTHGELGNGENTAQDAPVPVVAAKGSKAPLKVVTAIATGANYTLALMRESTVLAWGRGTEGALGGGNIQHQNTPMPVQAPSGGRLSGVAAIAAGAYQSMAWAY